MKPKIFINLPVADLNRAKHFYTQIGFSVNPQFTDETAAAMVFSDEIFVMLLTHEKFSMFTTKDIADVRHKTAAIFALEVESPERMNTMLESALAAGGTEPMEGKNYGFMQQRSMEDPDGHLWEVLFMDMSKFPKQ